MDISRPEPDHKVCLCYEARPDPCDLTVGFEASLTVADWESQYENVLIEAAQKIAWAYDWELSPELVRQYLAKHRRSQRSCSQLQSFKNLKCSHRPMAELIAAIEGAFGNLKPR